MGILSNDNMKEYNNRQLIFMLEIIDGYEFNKTNFNKFVDDIEALYNLVELDRSWKERFRAEWWELEQINAMQLYTKSIDPNDENEINIALENLKKLIHEVVVQPEENQQKI